jgi:hypothetical protein
MKDNFDLKKFLTENKALQNLNPLLSESKGMDMDGMRKKIREMILAELGNPDPYDVDPEEEAYGGEGEKEEDLRNYFPTFRGLEYSEEDLEEAKKKKDEEVEDVETTDVEATEEVPAEEAPAKETPDAGGGLEDVAADMQGTEGELMDALMKAFKIAKGMNNEKLETQVGNTLKFFVSEYIGGGEG